MPEVLASAFDARLPCLNRGNEVFLAAIISENPNSGEKFP
jgi:hypothetical protein